MQTNKTVEKRLACVDWDNDVPTCVKSNGRKIHARRVVITRGVKKIVVDGSGEWAYELRKGNEVRLCDSEGEEMIRLYPITLKDMKTVVVAAQVLKNSALRNCLSDKHVTVVPSLPNAKPGIKTMSDAKAFIDKQDKLEKSLVHVTPDQIVKCPKCGTRIRVGKVLQ